MTRAGGWCLLVVLALGLSLVAVRSESRRGLWLDEVYSLQLARGDGYAHRNLPLHRPLHLSDVRRLTSPPDRFQPGEVLGHQRADSHPPGYFTLLHTARWLGPASPAAARGLSALFYGLTVVVVCCSLWQVTRSVGAGLVAAGVVALALPGVWYASEIRHYTLGLFLTAAALASLIGFVSTDSRTRAWAMLFALSAAAAALTHYFLAGPIIAACAAALVVGRARRRELLAWSAGAALLVAAVWGPFLLAQLRVSQGYTSWISVPVSPGSLVAAALSGLPAVLGSPGGAAVGLLLVALLAAGFVRCREGPQPLRRAWTIALAALFGAVLLPLAADLVLGTVHTWQLRYLLFALVPLAILCGLMWVSRDRWLGRAGALCLLALAALGHLEPRTTETDYAAVVREIDRLLAHLSTPPTLVFAVKPPGDAEARTDVETDVRLLALLLAANAPPGARQADPPILLTDATTAPDDLAASTVLLITAWRPVTPSELLPRYRATDTAFFPSEGIRLTLLRPPESSPVSGEDRRP